MAEKGNKRAEKALKLADNYDSLISTILIGNNIVNILSASLSTLFFTGLISDSKTNAASAAVSSIQMLAMVELCCIAAGIIIVQLLPKIHRE